jgi:membrane protein implicated in regulation of membrane protease activity
MAFLSLWQFWAVLAIVLLIGEIASPGFVLGCFALACVPPLALGLVWPSLAGASLDGRLALAVFALSSLAGLWLIRPSVVRHLYGAKERKSDVDGMVGSLGVVVKAIPSGETGGGYVKLRGSQWWAFHVDGRSVPEGTEVEVVRVSGAKVMVRESGRASEEDERR